MPLKYYVIDANNVPQNQTYSYENGNSNISMDIQSSDREFLIPQSVKLVANLVLKDTNGVEQNGDECGLSVQSGIASLINEVSLVSLQSNQSISDCKNYSRLLSTINSTCRGDFYDTIQCLSHEAVGYGQRRMDNSVGIYTANPTTETAKQTYSMDVMMGLIQNSQKLYLGRIENGGCGGLRVNFLLNPASQSIVVADNTNAPFTYELSSVKLQYSTYYTDNEEEINSGRVLEDWQKSYVNFVRETENRQPPMSEVNDAWKQVVAQSITNKPPYKYRDITSYLGNINSTNANITLALNKSNVSAIGVNFVPNDFVNSVAVDNDGNKTYDIMPTDSTKTAPIKEVGFTRAGQFDAPFTYNLTTNVDENLTPNEQMTTTTRAEVFKPYSDMFININDNKYQQASVENSLQNNQYSNQDPTDIIGGKGAGISTGKNGVNGTISYVNKPLNINVQTNVNNNTFDLFGAYVYAVCENEMSFSNGSLSVSS